MFFKYEQTTSGGVCKPPCCTLYVEADNYYEANNIAKTIYGLYFNGVDEEIDCPCCGDRWYPADSYTSNASIRQDLLYLKSFFNEYNDKFHKQLEEEAGRYITVHYKNKDVKHITVEEIKVKEIKVKDTKDENSIIF